MPTKILIVDDDPVVRHIIAAVLKSAGHTFDQVTSGRACVQLLATQAAAGELPTLIFLDLQLGDMNGAEVLEEIRRITGTTHVPTILLSANSEEESRALFPGIKPDGYLEKPFPPTRVLELIAEILKPA